jgi:hypothetical protein
LDGGTNGPPFYAIRRFPSAVKEVTFSVQNEYALLDDGSIMMPTNGYNISEKLKGTTYVNKRAVGLFGWGFDCAGLVFDDGTAMVWDSMEGKVADPDS